MRGRSSGKWNSSAHQQKLEIGGGISNSITSVLKDFYVIEIINDMETKEKKPINIPPELEGKKFRIRKLTPRECFRLMDVEEEDIDTIQATGLSNSAQYKLAGNSIVVNCLYHLFRKMFIEIDADKSDKPIQLKLF